MESLSIPRMRHNRLYCYATLPDIWQEQSEHLTIQEGTYTSRTKKKKGSL